MLVRELITMKYWKIHFALKKGSSEKYKPQLRYIQNTYRPQYLTISQTKYYEVWKSKPMPIIEFIVAAHDAIHFMDDFTHKYPKLMVTGGAGPYEWSKIPSKTKRRFSKEFKLKMKVKRIDESVRADNMRNRFNLRVKESKK